MSMWKKIFLVIFFMCAMYFGGLSTQSSSPLAQGFGFFTVIVAFGLLYVISRVMWQAMGFVSSFLIIGSVVVFILYSLGLLGQNKSLGGFISGTSAGQLTRSDSRDDIGYADIEAELYGSGRVAGNQALLAGVTTEQTESANRKSVEKITETENAGWLETVKEFFDFSENAQAIAGFNPSDYPYLEGSATVVTASVLRMEGLYIKLLGIDAPDPAQTCADRHGGPYRCGKRAITWLQNWLHNQPLRCHIVGKVEYNHTTGVCFTIDGQYDVAAATVSAGWALAYTQNTNIYEPYEEQAAAERRGLWSGRFYKPWDWRRIQNRKVKIQINSTKSGGFGFMDWLDGLFK